MKFLRSCAAVLMLLALAGCGGGGNETLESLDETEDTYIGTLTIGETSHVCRSMESHDLCRAGDCRQCQCLTGCPAGPGEPIVRACRFYDTNPDGRVRDQVGSVPQTGCTLATKPPQTLACQGSTLFVLEGLDHTREAVVEQGISFAVVDTVDVGSFTFKCATP